MERRQDVDGGREGRKNRKQRTENGREERKERKVIKAQSGYCQRL